MLRKYIDFELLLSYKTPKSIKTAQSPVFNRTLGFFFQY